MADIVAAIELAEELDVDYILMAMSIKDNGQYEAFESLVANANATVVASAGNNGSNASSYLPASIDGVITAGAVDGEYVLRDSSNYGSCVDYYELADSTSAAAAIVLGKMISQPEFLSDFYIDNDDHSVYCVDGEFFQINGGQAVITDIIPILEIVVLTINPMK